MPWVMIVDSRATIGRLPASALAASPDKSNNAFAAMPLAFVSGAPERWESPS